MFKPVTDNLESKSFEILIDVRVFLVELQEVAFQMIHFNPPIDEMEA